MRPVLTEFKRKFHWILTEFLRVEACREHDVSDDWWDPIPKTLWKKMFQFQREGVLFALRHQGRVMIADEMGLGKTVQALQQQH